MALNVDPAELISVASQLANTATGTAAALPRGWVVPGAADPVSVQAVPTLNRTKAALANKVTDVLQHGVHATAANIGASAADYTTADDEGARRIGGAGGTVITNPVSGQGNYVRHVVPETTAPVTEAVDPLTLAEQFHSGPGTSHATALADEFRRYLGDAHAAAHSGVRSAAQTVRNWHPVGQDAAKTLTGHADSLDRLGGGLQALIDGIDTYSNAFATAKAAHPTPAEIKAARRELLTAMRSKNSAAIAEAMAKFEEQNARSAEVLTNYAATMGVDMGKTIAAGKVAQCSGSGSGGGDASGSGGGSGDSSGSGGGSGNSSATVTTSTSGATSASGDSGLLNSLTGMLPELLTMGMTALQQLAPQNSGAGTDSLGGSGAYGTGDPSISDLSNFGAGPGAALGNSADSVGAATATAQDISLGAMPMVAAAAAMTSALPSAAVTDPVTSAITAAEATAARGAAGGGAGGMPYMPMMPGMGNTGGGAGGDRNRVVAWHPDRLMYVDDTPHTEQVIGEKPSIAPTVTPPTPANQATSQGGST